MCVCVYHHDQCTLNERCLSGCFIRLDFCNQSRQIFNRHFWKVILAYVCLCVCMLCNQNLEYKKKESSIRESHSVFVCVRACVWGLDLCTVVWCTPPTSMFRSIDQPTYEWTNHRTQHQVLDIYEPSCILQTMDPGMYIQFVYVCACVCSCDVGV